MVMVTKTEVEERPEFYIGEILKGEIIIYPTDTIYGIGCDATNAESVKKLREIKGRNSNPFSIIAPSIEWIKENCDTEGAEEWLTKLPGPYTLILKLKNKKCIASETNNNMDTIGIRIPDHWFTEFLQKTKKPIITTSVNKQEEPPMTSIDDIDPAIKVKYLFYEGPKQGKPSTIVNLTGPEIKVIER